MLALGKVCPTEAVFEMLAASGEALETFLARHRRGDAGDIDRWATQFDEEYLASDRVHSIYRLKTGNGLWLTTEADRSLTTVLAVPRTVMEECDIRA